MELAASITDNLNLNMGVGYTDAEFKDDVPQAGIESGDLLADVPEWTYNISLDWTIPIKSGEVFTVLSCSLIQ